MPATTPHSPPAPPPAIANRKPRRRPATPPKPAAPVYLAADVLAMMATLPTTPTLARLASALGWPSRNLVNVLASLERVGIVETWPDPDRSGNVRVMLSARTIARLGLVLSPRADRWIGHR